MFVLVIFLLAIPALYPQSTLENLYYGASGISAGKFKYI